MTQDTTPTEGTLTDEELANMEQFWTGDVYAPYWEERLVSTRIEALSDFPRLIATIRHERAQREGLEAHIAQLTSRERHLKEVWDSLDEGEWPAEPSLESLTIGD